MKALRLVALLLLAGPALAQDPDDPGGALQEDGLAERKPAEQPVLDDPDGTLLKKTNELRTGVEATINKLQETVQNMHGVELELPKAVAKKFESLDKRLERVTADLLKATDAFTEKHAADLEAYRAAVGAGLGDAKDKAAKAVVQHRNTFIKALEKVQKAAEQVAKDTESLAAKALPKEAAPAEAPASAPAPAPEEGAEEAPKEE